MQAAIEIGAHSGGETVKMVSSGPSSLDMMMTEQSSAHRIPSGDVSPLVNVAVNDSDRRFPELRVTRDDHDLANGMTHGHAQFTARIVILDILCATHLLVCHTSACVPHICPIVLRSYSPSRSAFLQANRAFTKSLYCCLFSYQSNCRIPVAQDGCLIRSNASSRDTPSRNCELGNDLGRDYQGQWKSKAI
jgi:hypothetical protein